MIEYSRSAWLSVMHDVCQPDNPWAQVLFGNLLRDETL